MLHRKIINLLQKVDPLEIIKNDGICYSFSAFFIMQNLLKNFQENNYFFEKFIQFAEEISPEKLQQIPEDIAITQILLNKFTQYFYIEAISILNNPDKRFNFTRTASLLKLILENNPSMNDMDNLFSLQESFIDLLNNYYSNEYNSDELKIAHSTKPEINSEKLWRVIENFIFNNIFTTKQQILLNLSAIHDTIIVFQYSTEKNYRHWLPEEKINQSLDKIMTNIAGDTLLKSGGISQLAHFSGVLDKNSLIDCLKLLTKTFGDIPSKIPFMLSAEHSQHAISIVLENNHWSFMDINSVNSKNLTDNFDIFNLENLAEKIADGFTNTEQDSRDEDLFSELIFDMDEIEENKQFFIKFKIYFTHDYIDEIKIRYTKLKQNIDWINIFTMDEQKSKYKVSTIYGNSFLYIDMLYDDSDTSEKQIIELINLNPEESKKNLAIPLIKSLNYKDILQAILNTNQISFTDLILTLCIVLKNNLPIHKDVIDLLHQLEIPPKEMNTLQYNEWSNMLLCLAAKIGDISLIEKINLKSPDINLICGIIAAAENGKTAAINLLLNLNKTQENLTEALTIALTKATENSFGETVRFLLNMRLLTTDQIKQSGAIDIAITKKELGILNQLLNAAGYSDEEKEIIHAQLKQSFPVTSVKINAGINFFSNNLRLPTRKTTISEYRTSSQTSLL